MAADYTSGGVIPPGSWVTFGAEGCELHVPPQPQTTNVTFTAAGALEQAFANCFANLVRSGRIQIEHPRADEPAGGSAGALAKV